MSALVLFFLWSLVEVHSQTVPYVSFMGESLPNHSYVDLTLVGNVNSDPGNTVRCITDLSTCCSYNQGIHRGDWYFPNGSALQPPSSGDSIFRTFVLSGLYYVVDTIPCHCLQLVYITVLFQLLLSVMILTFQWERQSMWDCMPVEVMS